MNPMGPPNYAPGFFGKFDPNGPQRNPGQTNPFPMPTDTPAPLHDCPLTPVIWGPGSVAGNPAAGVVEATLFTATWNTPIFDLRPEFRGAGQASPSGTTNAGARGTCPIWRAGYGGGGQLFVQIENLLNNARNITGLVVHAIESGHVNDPNRVQTIEQVVDISSYFTALQQSSVLAFVPPGSGFPMRFWQLALLFDILADTTDPPLTAPTLAISASYY